MQDVNRQLFSDSVIEEVMLNASVSRERALQIIYALGTAAILVTAVFLYSSASPLPAVFLRMPL